MPERLAEIFLKSLVGVAWGPPGGGPSGPPGGPGGPPSDGEPLAFFLWGNGFVLDDDATGEWQTLVVELCSGGSRAVDPFVDI